MQRPLDLAYLFHEALTQIGWEGDAQALADRVQRLNIGLPAEDEFSVVCAWLGRCELLHKLDQQQVPVTSKERFQVPDLLARFSTQRGTTPVLIEVKSRKGNVLSMKPDYLERLKNYAQLLNVPLLIAWKTHVWTLFEAKHLAIKGKNYSISANDAMQQSLMGALAGDTAYIVGRGAGIHLQAKKDALLNRTVTTEGVRENWRVLFDRIEFSDYEGNRRTDLSAEVQAFFYTWDLSQTTEQDETRLRASFIVEDNDYMQFGHSALVRLLHWESVDKSPLRWRGLLERESATAIIKNFPKALEAAHREKVVSHILYVRPLDMPDFITDEKPWKRD